MNDSLLKAGYDEQKLRIERLESWVAEAISKPSMSREMRLQGLDLVDALGPNLRQSVERICPTRVQGLELNLEIER